MLYPKIVHGASVKYKALRIRRYFIIQMFHEIVSANTTL